MESKNTRHNIIGIVYDFDGTLSPNNMQEDTIFKTYNICSEELWKKTEVMSSQGFERTLAYLKLLIHETPFKDHPLTREGLRKLGQQLEYYPGVQDMFNHINGFVASMPEAQKWGIEIEHYIISSGMIEILEGSSIYQHFRKVYACEYDYNEAQQPVFPKLVINDTNKTQFLFRINKGKLELNEDINSHMPENERRIPFRNMLYIGDSLTDIPSITVMKKSGGHTIAVFNPNVEVTDLVLSLVEHQRVDHFAPADYRQGKLLMRIIEMTIKKIVHTIAYHGSCQMSFDWVKKHRK